MDFQEFKQLSSQGNLIPVYKKIVADMETPVSVLSRFVDDEHVFLLESVESTEKFGRYSFIGVNPSAIFNVDDQHSIFDLRKMFEGLKTVKVCGLPPLTGGAVGYMDYEIVEAFEELKLSSQRKGKTVAKFMMTDQMIVFDNIKHVMFIIVSVKVEEGNALETLYVKAQEKIKAIEEKIKSPVNKIDHCSKEVCVTSCMNKEDFMSMVEKAKKYIYDGDIIQVVLSQKFKADCDMHPFYIYRALRLINPSPYMFFIKIADRVLIGSSPETLAKFNDGKVFLRPIAGSKPRGKDEKEDSALVNELLQDPKERAEHLMLVDLARNDAGRIAKPGTVQVKDFMTVEKYSHVMHLVSTVEALACEDKDAFDVLKAVFPAGTLSGAPKVRAMEIIDELEKSPRCFYGGAVGYFSFSGNMDLAITIRTMEIEAKQLSFQAGAGIVYDSHPEKEYQETLNKSKALVEAIRIASSSF